MSTGTACWIFRDLSKTTYTDEEKLEAIYIVANMATHNAIKKSEMVSAIKWLLRKVRGWIPVEEQLPEDGETVFCTDGTYIFCVVYDANLDIGFGDMDGILAWMPLPEPYKAN